MSASAFGDVNAAITPVSAAALANILGLAQQFAVDTTTTAGLTFGLTAGKFAIAGGTIVNVAASTHVLPDNATRFICTDAAGVLSVQVAVPVGSFSLWQVTTLAGAITAMVDLRFSTYPFPSSLAILTSGGVDYLTAGLGAIQVAVAASEAAALASQNAAALSEAAALLSANNAAASEIAAAASAAAAAADALLALGYRNTAATHAGDAQTASQQAAQTLVDLTAVANTVADDAVAAQNAKNLAETAANLALAGVTPFIPGAYYYASQRVISPTSFLVYYALSAGIKNTDPATDGANWALWTFTSNGIENTPIGQVSPAAAAFTDLSTNLGLLYGFQRMTANGRLANTIHSRCSYAKQRLATTVGESWVKIATLPATSGNTGDQLRLDLSLSGASSTQREFMTVMLGQRGAFSAVVESYWRYGGTVRATYIGIRAYTEVDGTTSVYMYCNATVNAELVVDAKTVGFAQQATLISPSALVWETVAPTGVLAFDSLTAYTGALVYRTSSGVSTTAYALKFPATMISSSDANTLDEYREATATLTATGMTTSPTGTASFVRVGANVTLEIPAISGISDATSFTLTGLPTTARPSAARTVVVPVQDNTGAFFLGVASIGTNGIITLYPVVDGSGAWTNAGTKSIGKCSVSYII